MLFKDSGGPMMRMFWRSDESHPDAAEAATAEVPRYVEFYHRVHGCRKQHAVFILYVSGSTLIVEVFPGAEEMAMS